MNWLIDLYDKLPRWVRVGFWLALSAFVSAASNAVSTGQWKVSPEWVPVINIILVAAKDFANKRSKSSSTP